MATLAERAKSEDVHVGRALLAAVLWLFWAVGFVVGKVFVALSFAGGAVKVGWADARGAGRGSGR